MAYGLVIHIIVQFKLLAEKILDQPALATDPKFATNEARVVNRTELINIITRALMKQNRTYWIERFTGMGYFPTSFGARVWRLNDQLI